MNSKKAHNFLGELIGTFILVFFGCGTIAVTVLFSAHVGLFQVAIMWGLGVSLAIYTTRHLSCAHLNPAVSLAMVVGRRMKVGRLIEYWAGQFLGAFLAAAILYLLFSSSIAQYELLHGIVRGSPGSIRTAMIFGEFYPNPSMNGSFSISTTIAFCAESIGTFILVFLIFSLTEGCNVGRPDDSLTPLFIGLAVTVIIGILAPLTQAGINPARDLSPRVFSYLAGWKRAALGGSHFGFLVVYVLGPFAGAAVAALFFSKIVQPVMADKQRCKEESCCK